MIIFNEKNAGFKSWEKTIEKEERYTNSVIIDVIKIA